MSQLSNKDLEKRIDAYYKEFDFVKLPYQRDTILQAIAYFFCHYKGSSKIQSVLANIYLPELEQINTNQVISYGEKQKYYIINFDVGLGKTITSIITALMIQDLIIYITDKELELFHSTKKQNIQNQGTVLGKAKEKRLVEEIEKAIQGHTSQNIPIHIIARKSILSEFKILLKDYESQRKIKFLPSGRGIDTVDYAKGFCRGIFGLFSYNHREEVRALYADEDLTYRKSFCYESNGIGDIYIVDEWGTDPVFFGNGMLADTYNSKSSIQKNFVLGLTANASIERSQRGFSFHKSSPRYMKSDPKIQKQLREGKLYSGQDFFYRLIKIKNNEILETYLNYKRQKEKSISSLDNQVQKLRQEKGYLIERINSLLQVNDPSQLDTIIEEIKLLKASSQHKNQIQTSEMILKKNEAELERQITRLSTYLRNNFIKVFHQAGLSYLLEKNTILVLDESFTDEKIQEIREEFRSMEFTPVSAVAAKNVKTPGHILIAKKEEIVRGLNLQHFDAILFTYVDNMTLEEIYQGVGRLDRIGNVSDKEIIFLGHSVAPNFVETVLANKDKHTGSLSFSNIQELQQLTEKEANFLKGMKKIEISEKEQELITDLNLKITEDTDKKKIEEKVKFIKTHIKHFKKLIKDIDKNVRQAIESADKISGSSSSSDFEKMYLDNVLSIF